MFREDAIAAGLPPHDDPNDIAVADYLFGVPVNPTATLWQEVRDLLDGYDGTEDYYERCADACRGVLIRQHSSTGAHGGSAA